LILLLIGGGDSLSPKKLDRLFFFAVIVNLIYGIIELAIYFEYLPSFINFRVYLTNFAPEERFLRNRMMSFGFFQNSTAYEFFGFIAFIHCLSRVSNIDSGKGKYFLFSLFSFAIIVLSTSRTLLAAAFIYFSFFSDVAQKTRWNLLLAFVFSVVSAAILISLFSLQFTLFSRFTRLVEGGLEGDYSLNMRLTTLWPNALEFYYDLGHPTFTNPSKFVGTIDSGYLTYLIQGGWLMLFTIFSFLLFLLFVILRRIFLSSLRSYYNYFLLFLLVYIALGMLISNPLRNPTVIVFLCFAVFGFSARRYSGAKV
jgi:hypothetical protein